MCYGISLYPGFLYTEKRNINTHGVDTQTDFVCLNVMRHEFQERIPFFLFLCSVLSVLLDSFECRFQKMHLVVLCDFFPKENKKTKPDPKKFLSLLVLSNSLLMQSELLCAKNV